MRSTFLHRQPASLKHKHQKNHIAASPLRYEQRMPPSRNRQLPEHNLSWFSAHRRRVTVRSVLEINQTSAFLNGSDTTCGFTTSHISTHHTKSLSLGRTRASVSGLPSAAYSRSITCRGKLKYPPTTSLTSVVSVIELTRPIPRSALPINGLSSTSSPSRDHVDDHATRLFFQSAPSQNQSRNRSLTRTT